MTKDTDALRAAAVDFYGLIHSVNPAHEKIAGTDHFERWFDVIVAPAGDDKAMLDAHGVLKMHSFSHTCPSGKTGAVVPYDTAKKLLSAALATPASDVDTIGSHFGNGGGFDGVAGDVAPVAWLYIYTVQYVPKMAYTAPLKPVVSLSATRWATVPKHWTETPLYAHPPAYTVDHVAGGEAGWKERGWMPNYIVDKACPAKPLAWRKPTDHPQDGFGEPDIVAVADGIGGRYSIREDSYGVLLWWAHDEFIFEPCKSIEEAKSKAEVDWQRRALAALKGPAA